MTYCATAPTSSEAPIYDSDYYSSYLATSGDMLDRFHLCSVDLLFVEEIFELLNVALVICLVYHAFLGCICEEGAVLGNDKHDFSQLLVTTRVKKDSSY